MVTSISVTERWKERLTKYFIEFIKRGEYEGKESFEAAGESVEVHSFKSNGSLFGQCTPFGTIILNESRVENLSQTARELVISHEVSHRDRNAIWKGTFLGSTVWFAVGFLVLILCVILLLGGASLTGLTGPIGAALLLMASFVVIVRAEETIADLQALRSVGKEQFVSGYKEIGEASSGTRRDLVMRKLLYTHPKHTVALHRFLEKWPNIDALLAR